MKKLFRQLMIKNKFRHDNMYDWMEIEEVSDTKLDNSVQLPTLTGQEDKNIPANKNLLEEIKENTVHVCSFQVSNSGTSAPPLPLLAIAVAWGRAS